MSRARAVEAVRRLSSAQQRRAQRARWGSSASCPRRGRSSSRRRRSQSRVEQRVRAGVGLSRASPQAIRLPVRRRRRRRACRCPPPPASTSAPSAPSSSVVALAAVEQVVARDRPRACSAGVAGQVVAPRAAADSLDGDSASSPASRLLRARPRARLAARCSSRRRPSPPSTMSRSPGSPCRAAACRSRAADHRVAPGPPQEARLVAARRGGRRRGRRQHVLALQDVVAGAAVSVSVAVDRVVPVARVDHRDDAVAAAVSRVLVHLGAARAGLQRRARVRAA